MLPLIKIPKHTFANGIVSTNNGIYHIFKNRMTSNVFVIRLFSTHHMIKIHLFALICFVCFFSRMEQTQIECVFIVWRPWGDFCYAFISSQRLIINLFSPWIELSNYDNKVNHLCENLYRIEAFYKSVQSKCVNKIVLFFIKKNSPNWIKYASVTICLRTIVSKLSTLWVST